MATVTMKIFFVATCIRAISIATRLPEMSTRLAIYVYFTQGLLIFVSAVLDILTCIFEEDIVFVANWVVVRDSLVLKTGKCVL